MMHMTFYWGKRVTILFDFWRTDSWLSYSFSLLACFIVAVFYQYMEDRRARMKLLSLSKIPPPYEDGVAAPLLGGSKAGRWAPRRIAGAILFGVNAAVGYMLMLAVMSFNGGVLIAVVAGLAAGYLVFRDGEEDTLAVDNPCACV